MNPDDATSPQLASYLAQTGRSEGPRPARRRFVWVLAAALLCWGMLAAPAFGQAPLETVERLYNGAHYEKALAELDTLRSFSREDGLGAAEYRILCLVALGKPEAAAAAVEELLQNHPDYTPSDRFSPQHRELFESTKQRVLPSLIRNLYTRGRTSYFSAAYEQAAKDFQAVLALLPQVEADAEFDRMRSLVSGFLRSSTVGTTEGSVALGSNQQVPALPVPAGTTGRQGSDSPSTVHRGNAAIYDLESADVVPPTPIKAVLPPVPASPGLAAPRTGLFEMVIDETGRVESVTVQRSIHPQTDSILIADIRKWRFKPAARGNQPVKFRKLIEVYAAAFGSLRR